MTVFEAGGIAEEVSLSAGQVRRLMRSLKLHRGMLQSGHDDASRLALHGCRPAYLLDFQLVFRYAFQPVERPDWASELQYLFDRSDTSFLIGPGTQIEINQFMHTAGVMFGDDGALEDPGPSASSDYEIYGLDGETVRVGIFRLNALLQLPNIFWYRDVVPNAEYDEGELNEIKAALGLRRRGRATANHWDALNWVAVTHMRQRPDTLSAGLFPYLLTATRPLLEAGAWKDEPVPVSRRPTDAIYTEILFDRFPDPVTASNHTIEMAVKAATLEESLRRSPAFLSPEEFEQEPEWEQAVREDRVPDELREQLQELARFVTDPVVAETQRIYDQTQLAAASAEQQRGVILGVLDESPRKLFDLIVEVNAVLSVGLEQSGFADLWTTVLDMATKRHSNRVSYELFERNADPEATQYLAVERYLNPKRRPTGQLKGSPGVSHGQFVLRWPSAMDAETVVASFSRAFVKHNVETVDLIVGTTTCTEHFGATLPISLQDVMQAVSEGDAEQALVSHQIQWIRMSARVFDLYADVAPSNLVRRPVVGVFVDSVNAEHLQDLYTRTAGRYLLPAWFLKAMDVVGRLG